MINDVFLYPLRKREAGFTISQNEFIMNKLGQLNLISSIDRITGLTD